MNPFDESPRGRPRDSSSEHTHELEAALRNLRPRAPEFDTDCFYENQNEADDPFSTVVTVNGTDSVSPVDTSSLQRSWVAVAGAWACGALVGGLAVFCSMQNRIATLQSIAKTPPQESSVVSTRQAETVDTGPRENEEPHSNSMDESTPGHVVGRAAYGMQPDDPHDHDWWAISGGGTSAWTAGSHLRQFVIRPATADRDVMPVSFSSNRLTDAELGLNVRDSQPPITRAWLLEEFLRKSRRTL